ncbi:MAG: hypothetical protein HQ549_06220 [Candidatus Omnitrophica bacterium]|nr:hypothetical protein [Candidatus Omnitrophota bacterium]
MRRILALVLIAVFMLSIAGCASKTEYDKLIDQKAAVEKKVLDLSADIDTHKKTIAARDMELRDLRSSLKAAEAKANSLAAEVAKLKPAEQ